MANQTQIKSLLARAQRIDPALRAILELMTDDLGKAYDELFPPSIPGRVAVTTTTTTTEIIAPTDLSYTINSSLGAILTWSQPSSSAQFFELRRGFDWDTADFVTRTPSLQIIVPPDPTGGNFYTMKSITSDGVYSASTATINVFVAAPAAIDMTARVIDNNVLLNWARVITTWEIAYYEIFKGGVSVGRHSGTFAVLFESAAGDFMYSIIATDIAGNVSEERTISVTVNTPPDFVLQYETDSAFLGACFNCGLFDGLLYFTFDNFETYQQHFVNHAWTSIQDQINAGFPLFISPSVSPSTYAEAFDIGALLSNVIITISYGIQNFVGSATVGIAISYSTDGVTYTAPVPGNALFITSGRYIRVDLTLAVDSTSSLSALTNLHLSASVKQITDSGAGSALAADGVTGTEVLFNKVFKDIDGIVVTPQATTPMYPVVSFVDIPDPVSFFVLMFDETGTQINGDFTWVARGVG